MSSTRLRDLHAGAWHTQAAMLFIASLLLALLVSPASAREPAQPDRVVPDYDGRPDAPPTPGQRALWVPRVILAPVWVVNEFVLRRPLEFLVLAAERGDAIQKLRYALTFGSGGRVGLVPTALFDFGVRPSVGLYLWANDLPTSGDRLRLSGAYGGSDWWQFRLRERIALGQGASTNTRFAGRHLLFEFAYEQRPDHLAYGVGPDLGVDPLAVAYEQKHLHGGVGLEWRFGELDGFAFRIDGGRRRFENGDQRIERADVGITALGDDPLNPGTTARRLAGGQAGDPILNTFTDYRYVTLDGQVALDSRSADAAMPGDGARLELGARVGHGTFIQPQERAFATGSLFSDPGLEGQTFAFIQPRLEAGLFWDIDNHRRVLSLSHHLEWFERVGGETAPYVELPSMGGAAPLRGFATGRFRGDSTLATVLRYQYPIWVSLDAFLFAGAGQAYGERFAGASLGSMAGTFGFGVRSATDRDAAFELLIGAGTTRFDAPTFAIESVRFLVGATQGF